MAKFCKYNPEGCSCNDYDPGPDGVTIVPLTAAEDVEMAEEAQRLSWERDCLTGETMSFEPTMAELGLVGEAMSRDDAKADAELTFRASPFMEDPPADLCGPPGSDQICAPGCCREGGPVQISGKGWEDQTLEINLAVDVAVPGWAPRLAELLGGAHMGILLQAEKITNGQRQKDYGTALDNHERIARFWTAFVQNLGVNFEFAPEHVAEMMILMKVARIQNEITEDGLVDIAGYANVLDKMGPQRAERALRLADEL